MNQKALELWQECLNETGTKDKLVDLETITIKFARKINQVLMQDVIDSKGNGYAGSEIKLENNEVVKIKEYTKKKLLTFLGDVEIERASYQLPGGGSIKPIDKLLGIEFCGRVSLIVENTLARLGTLLHYRCAVKEMESLLGIAVSHVTAKKYTEIEGAKALEIEPEQVKFDKKEIISMQIDGGRIRTKDGEGDGWKEVKVGIVTGALAKLQMSRINEHDKFMTEYSNLIKLHGYDTYLPDRSFVSDGAQWIQEDFAKIFLSITQALDYYHFTEHLNETAEEIYKKDKDKIKQWVEKIKALSFENNSEEIISLLEVEKIQQEKWFKNQSAAESLRKLINYVTNNKERIRYGKLKELGYDIGSGKIEATIKTLLNGRMKSASIRWITANAKKVLALRDLYFNDQWDLLLQKTA